MTISKEFNDDFYNRIRDNIDKFGVFNMGVVPEKGDGTQGFVYTIGNTEKGFPELIVTGNFDPRPISMLLNVMSKKQIELGRAFYDGEVVFPNKDNDVAKLMVRKVTDNQTAIDNWCVQAREFYRHTDFEPVIMQVLIPDENWNFPPDCSEPYNEQRIV